MRKNCSTCLYSGFGQCHFDDCKLGKNGIPTKWVPAPFWTPDTNADRIRAMTVEELAEVFSGMCKNSEMCGTCPMDGNCPGGSTDFTPWMQWLEQPAEE